MGVPKLDSNLDSGDGFFNWVDVEYCMLLIGSIPWLWFDYFMCADDFCHFFLGKSKGAKCNLRMGNSPVVFGIRNDQTSRRDTWLVRIDAKNEYFGTIGHCNGKNHKCSKWNPATTQVVLLFRAMKCWKTINSYHPKSRTYEGFFFDDQVGDESRSPILDG